MTKPHATLGWLERAFIIASLCCLLDAFYPVYLTYTGALGRGEIAYNIGQSDLLQSALYLGIYAVSAAAFFWRPSLRPVLRVAPAAFVVVALAALSVLWSVEPETSFRRAFALGGVTLFTFYLAARVSVSEFIDLLALTLRIILVASVLYYLLAPEAATMEEPHAGAWRGVMRHKNGLGWVASLGLLTFYYLAVQGQERAKNLGYAALSLALVFLSESATSVVLAGLIIGLDFVIVRLQRMSGRFYFGYILTICFLVGAALVLWEPALDLLGRDASLTGRTDVWAYAFEAAAHRPLLGYGYGAFWAANNQPAAYIWLMLEWEFTHAHNGWIETLLELGLAGVAAVFVVVAQAMARCLVAVREARLANARFLLQILKLVLVANMTESGLAQYNDFGWAVVLVVAAIMGRYAVARREGLLAPALIRPELRISGRTFGDAASAGSN